MTREEALKEAERVLGTQIPFVLIWNPGAPWPSAASGWMAKYAGVRCAKCGLGPVHVHDVADADARAAGEERKA